MCASLQAIIYCVCECVLSLQAPPRVTTIHCAHFGTSSTSDDDEKKKAKKAGERAPKPEVHARTKHEINSPHTTSSGVSCTSIVTKLPISRLRNKTKVD